MARKSTTVWRTGVLGLLIAVVPVVIYLYDKNNKVHTGAMLDVSVSIKTISHVRIDRFGDSVWEKGSGSGFLVSSKDCEVWTNHHVIADTAVIEVYPREWTHAAGIPATVVNSTPRSDIAILRMQSCAGILEARLGDSDAVRSGDETYAVGNPLGLNPDSVSRGIISHTERFMNGTTPYLQTDAAINPGNSGGALFNRKGEVIGINTAIATTRKGANAGIGYAIPLNMAKAVTEQLHQGPPSWGDAGISDIVSTLTPDEAEVFRVPDGYGAIIVITAPTEGASAGKLFARDVIFKIDDTGVTDAAQAQRVISSHNAGDTLTFQLVRAGEVRSVDIVLDEGWKANKAGAADYYDGYLGMTLETWRDNDGEQGRFTSPVITKVQNLGPAHKAHIASSQRAVGYTGPFLVPYILDVKTVTGVVFDGEYYPVAEIEDLDHFAAMAFNADTALLLEIELWGRSNPMDVDTSLQHVGTGFFKVKPALTTANSPLSTDEAIVEAAGEISSRTPHGQQEVHRIFTPKAP